MYRSRTSFDPHRTRLSILVVAFTVGAVGIAHGGPPRPTKFLKREVKRVRALLAEPAKPDTPEALTQDNQLKAIVEPVMEFDGLSQRSLRKHWPTLTPEQKSTFVETFRELVFRSYLKEVRTADQDYRIEYEDEQRQGDTATVWSVAKTRKAEIELVFKLNVRDGNRWVASDIVIDEVSLEENYREQFDKIIAKDGFEVLLDKMKKKVAELKKPAQAAPTTIPAEPVAVPSEKK